MGGAALALLLLLAAGPCAAQYEEYSVRGFPAAALEPLQRAYARALEHYAGAEWAESARELEASLRLHRLLRDSEAHCHRRCAAPAEGDPAEEPPAEEEPAAWEWERELQLFGQLLRRAGCLRACKRDLPVFQLRYPPAQTLRDFQRRQPYQYLHYALFKVRGPAGVQMPRNVAGGGSEGLHGLAVAGVRYRRPVLHCSDLQLLFYPLSCAPLLSPAIGHTPICASSCAPHPAHLTPSWLLHPAPAPWHVSIIWDASSRTRGVRPGPGAPVVLSPLPPLRCPCPPRSFCPGRGEGDTGEGDTGDAPAEGPDLMGLMPL